MSSAINSKLMKEAVDTQTSTRKSASNKSYLPSEVGTDSGDVLDYTVLKYGTDVSLRSNIGLYMQAVPVEIESNNVQAPNHQLMGNNTLITSKKSSIIYSLGTKGKGIGEPLDCIQFICIEDPKDHSTALRYGMTLTIRAPGAKDKLLGIKESKPGFYRNLVGQGERWVILKGSMTGRSFEDIEARGQYVRCSDLIILQSHMTEQFLSWHEGLQGNEAKLISRDSAGVLGEELWQVELFRSQSIPLWMNRPYLSNHFLLQAPASRNAQNPENSFKFLSLSASAPSDSLPPLNTFSLSIQQHILVRELLCVLSGIEGQYIRIKAPNTINPVMFKNIASASISRSMKELQFVIDVDSTDRSLANQVIQLLPICNIAIQIREFTKLHSRYDFGMISHAIVSTIKVIVREFDVLVAQLECLHIREKLTIQKLFYLLQPSRITLCNILYPLIHKLSDTVGGKMIDILHTSLLEQGYNTSRDLLLHILEKASVPFLAMLSQWLFRGELVDTYKEFMIQEDSSVTKETLEDDFNAQYWESRYTLRHEYVPKLLRDYAFKILIAGKYLNVIRGCLREILEGKVNKTSTIALMSASNTLQDNDVSMDGLMRRNTSWIHEFELPETKQLTFDLNSSMISLIDVIDESYSFSSRTLLRLLQDGYGLSYHLRSLRRFFLLENGDFFIQFMDTAEEELRKEVKDISLSRVQALLQLAVQTSTLAHDLNREELSCSLASHNLIQHLHLIQSAGESSSEAFAALSTQGLKGVEALTLDYRVGWPLSIVLSKRAITKYQLLSRLLYFSKHVERRVLSCWKDLQNTKLLNVREAMGPSYCLRHRMLHFLHNFVYYMTVEVINPRSHEMTAAIQSAQDIDEMLMIHERFLDTCLKECLLASQNLLKILTKIMTTCLIFADNMKLFTQQSEAAIASTTHETPNYVANSDISPAANTLLKHQRTQKYRQNLQTNYIQQEVSNDHFVKLLNKFIQTFDIQLKEFLDSLWSDSSRHHPQLSNLCVRLDYNGFYSNKFVPESGIVS